MTVRLRLSRAAALAGLAALAACGPVGATREAGWQVDEGGFGNPTMNNVLVLSGQRPFVLDLARRFVDEAPSVVTFAFDSAVLDAAARAALDRQADWIRQFPEVRFSVYGHTDLTGSEGYNHALGRRRAQAVVSYLASRGIERSRLEALVSMGEREPIVPTPLPEQANRRAVTEVAGFVQRHPMVLNGRYAEVVWREYVWSAQPPHPPAGGYPPTPPT
ncbi:MAG: OmpA family protein [Rhodobacteraceae bacterium]|nr:OmpA family protein [Paracoccaceae bacterium]